MRSHRTVEDVTTEIQNRLWRGASRNDIAQRFVRQGWSLELARFIVADVEQAMRPVFRRRSLRLAAGGMALASVGLLAIALTAALSGIFPLGGPLVIIWVTVVAGALRTAAGLLASRRFGGWCTGRRSGPAQSRRPSQPARDCLKEDARRLGVAVDCSPEELHAAYREIVKRWHPDRFANSGEQRLEAEGKLVAVNLAYARLKEQKS